MGGGKGPFGTVSIKESGKDKLLRAVSVACLLYTSQSQAMAGALAADVEAGLLSRADGGGVGNGKIKLAQMCIRDST